MKPAILTADGQYFDFTDPAVGAINIETIAHALSHLCRFTGHTKAFYSVAQHSVIVSHLVPSYCALAGLLHDASEAYLGDVSSPLKQLLPDYRHIERSVETAISAVFGLVASDSVRQAVRAADLRALVTEHRDLMPSPQPHCIQVDADAWRWTDGIEPWETVIVPVDSATAKQFFLNRFKELS